MTQHAILRTGMVLTLAAVLAGCSLAPTHERPAAPIAAQWPGQGATDAAPASAAATLNWQDFIVDADLRKLIDMALANNRDLRQTLLNVQAARAQYRVQRADRLPGVEAQGSGTRQRVPADLSATQQSQVQSQWQAGVGLAAFEIDLFGRVRNLSESALQEYLATESGARSAEITLVAEVVQAYLTRDGALRRRLLTADTLRTRESSLGLIQERRKAGTATALDYQEALGLTEQARAELERTDREFRQASNALVLLVGAADLGPFLPLQPATGPLLVQDLAAGTPSALLVHRPDIHAAEARLRARNADIGAARAAFFPRISITGFLGSSSADIGNLFDAGQRAWSFAPQLSLPIFSGGRNVANLDLASVRKDIAVAAYEQTIQTAFREVADALAATDTLRREEAAREALVRSSREALRLSEARYKAGVDDYLRYLDAQRSAYTNESAFIETSTQRQIALSTLFRALGGGWNAADGESAAADSGTIEAPARPS